VSEMTEPTIGKRIRELRRPRYTQVDLAVAADISVDVIRKLEQDRRHTASITTLARIARVLGVDLADLLAFSRPVLTASGDQDPVIAIRDALTSVDDLLGELDDVDVPDLTEFSRAVTYAFGLYWAGRYRPLTTMLPRLLTEAAAATHGAAPADSARAADLAAQVHRIAASALLHLGAPDLGHVAAREGLRLAARASDPLRAAAVRCSLGHVLMRQGRFVDAERVSVATAEAVQPHGDASTAQLSVYGGLLLRGATAAARQRRAGAAADLLAEAATVAQRTGTGRTDYDVGFGPGHAVMGAWTASLSPRTTWPLRIWPGRCRVTQRYGSRPAPAIWPTLHTPSSVSVTLVLRSRCCSPWNKRPRSGLRTSSCRACSLVS